MHICLALHCMNDIWQGFYPHTAACHLLLSQGERSKWQLQAGAADFISAVLPYEQDNINNWGEMSRTRAKEFFL